MVGGIMKGWLDHPQPQTQATMGSFLIIVKEKHVVTTVFRVSVLVPTCKCRPNMTTTPQLSARAVYISLNSYFHFFSKMPKPHSPTMAPTTKHATPWYANGTTNPTEPHSLFPSFSKNLIHILNQIKYYKLLHSMYLFNTNSIFL